jgi:hypothetical protein
MLYPPSTINLFSHVITNWYQNPTISDYCLLCASILSYFYFIMYSKTTIVERDREKRCG